LLPEIYYYENNRHNDWFQFNGKNNYDDKKVNLGIATADELYKAKKETLSYDDAKNKIYSILAKYQSKKIDNIPYATEDRDLKRLNIIYDASNNIETILEHQQVLSENFINYIMSLFIFSFVLAGLLWIYRHTTLVAFALSFLVGFLIFVSSSILLFVSRGDSDLENKLWTLSFVILGGLLALIYLSDDNKRYKRKAIALNLFPFAMGLFSVFVYFVYRAKQYRDFGETHFESAPAYQIIFAIMGIIILLIPTVLYPNYKKWWAAADNA
jgi:uncharacterized membrane protein YdcZ (DUF606 family)